MESVVVHIPHSSDLIPKEYRELFYLSKKELTAEHNIMIDRYTNILFSEIGQEIIFPVSRLLVDVERFRDDREEEMSTMGMGAVYRLTSEGGVLKSFDGIMRERLLCEFYDSHHKRFSAAVESKLKEYNKCLIIDGHSFSNIPLHHENDKSLPRPDFCIGYDEYHTPKVMIDNMVDILKQKGYTVKINSPFSGTIVPIRYFHNDERVKSVMLEVNRSLYMDDDFKKNNKFEVIKQDIKNLLSKIIVETYGRIHYSNKGAHIVPNKKEGKE